MGASGPSRRRASSRRSPAAAATVAWVADGTPALEASLRPTAMAFGPDALMYVADDQEVLRLEPNGTFTRVLGENTNEYAEGIYGIGGPARSASADGANGVAIDSSGNIYVAGSNTKAILMIDPQGIVQFWASCTRGGPAAWSPLPTARSWQWTNSRSSDCRRRASRPSSASRRRTRCSYLGITGFSPNGIVSRQEAPRTSIRSPATGIADKSALIMIPAQGAGSPSVLWEQRIAVIAPSTVH